MGAFLSLAAVQTFLAATKRVSAVVFVFGLITTLLNKLVIPVCLAMLPAWPHEALMICNYFGLTTCFQMITAFISLRISIAAVFAAARSVS